MAVLLAGCASPGPPLPPSLKLPEIVTGLTATRVGDAVTLRWTTPSRTTDKLLITGSIMAEICRETPQLATARRSGQNAGKTAACSAVTRMQVTPGESEAVDTLPASLASAPARLLAYRVQLLNSAGRTAGPSPVAFAVSGPAPQPVQDLRGAATKGGAVLEWKAEDGGADAIELDRTAIDATAADSGSERKSGLPGATGLPGGPKEPVESRFRAGAAVNAAGTVAGGTVDRTARIGHTYRYLAYRVRTVVLGEQTLEVRSLPSSTVTVAMLDVFPPEIPAGLVAVPGFVGEQGEKPTIDLSWDPNMEPRIAGYKVYRRDLAGASDSWQRLGSELVPVAAYRDLAVVAGQKYAYRVTAVNEAGNESAPSGEAAETAPAQ
jgi:hypothetical protein